MDITQLERNAEVAANLLKAMSNDKRLIIMCALFKGENASVNSKISSVSLNQLCPSI